MGKIESNISGTSIFPKKLVHIYSRPEWKPSPDQIKSMSDLNSLPECRINSIIHDHRDHLWINGDEKDIKRGDYLVFHEEGPDRNDEFYDSITMELNRIPLISGWTRGLIQNIHMSIGDTQVVVVDNHNYALAFILELFRCGLIRSGESMLHIDEHDDLEPNRSFDAKKYRGLRGEMNRIRYLQNMTNIANWQFSPLIESKMVSSRKWHWISMEKGCWHVCGMESQNILINSPSEVGGRNRIIDIDIDVLNRLDSDLSDEEKSYVLSGHIPPNISHKIYQIAEAAKKAKVITIASNPGYIEQDRAIIYIKQLIKDIRSAG